MVAISLEKELCSECRPTEEEILGLELEQTFILLQTIFLSIFRAS